MTEYEDEKALLGAVMLHPECIHEAIAAGVARVDFALPHHALVWTTIVSLEEAGKAVSLPSVRRESGTDPVFLSGLLDSVLFKVTHAEVRHIARAVADAGRRRRLGEALRKAAEADSPEAQLEAATAAVGAHAGPGAGLETRHVGDLAKASFASFEALAHTGAMIGLSTGFRDLDRILCGLRAGDLVLVAARPAMGKTSFALQLSRGSLARTLIVSLEMSGLALVRRLIAAEAQVNQRAIQYGLRKEQWDRLAQASTAVFGLPLWINERASTVGSIRSAAKRLEGLGLIVVDYLQLMEEPSSRENRQQQVAAVSRGLKRLAQDLGVPIIALSQLSRPADQRKDKRPQLTDLRESGALEQDADVVMMIYREEVHNPTDHNAGRAEIIVAKQRDGDTGTVKLMWDKTTTRFFEEEPETYTPTQESLL